MRQRNKTNTYTARASDHVLRFRVATKATQQRGPERVAIVDEDVIVRALGAHAAEFERYKLTIILRPYQPLAVRVLGGGNTPKNH